MPTIKGIALGLAGFLLFAALSMFGLVLTINVTLLNSSFTYGEIQKLNIPAVVHELVAESTPSGEKYFISGIDKAISDIKPWLQSR